MQRGTAILALVFWIKSIFRLISFSRSQKQQSWQKRLSSFV